MPQWRQDFVDIGVVEDFPSRTLENIHRVTPPCLPGEDGEISVVHPSDNGAVANAVDLSSPFRKGCRKEIIVSVADEAHSSAFHFGLNIASEFPSARAFHVFRPDFLSARIEAQECQSDRLAFVSVAK